MRHGKKFNHLSRTSSHRSAMLSNMAASLILHKRISTTVAKAKALRVYVEPLLTKSKADSTHSRRIVFSYLQSNDAVTMLFRDVAPKIADRPGGYTRIIKTGNRLGDNAEMCFIELVDYNELMLADKTTKKAKTTTRRSRGKKKDASAAPVVDASAEAATEEPSATITEAPAKTKAVAKPKAEAEAPAEAKAEKPAEPEAKDAKPEKPKAKKEKDKKEDTDAKGEGSENA